MAEPSTNDQATPTGQISADSLLELLGVTSDSRGSRRSVWLVPVVAGLVGFLLTAAIVRWELGQVEQANLVHFDSMAQRVEREITRRLHVYNYGLMGTRSVFAASDLVTREEFRAMVLSRNINSEFPGALGIGFIRRVGRDDLAAYVQRVRNNGLPDFTVKSDSQVGSYYIIEYVEPMEHNLPAIGFDIAQEPRRREAANRAMASNEASLTSSVSLVQSGEDGPGFLYLLPVYKPGLPINSLEERYTALEGWVFMPIVAAKLFRGITDNVGKEIDFEVFDAPDMSSSTLVYDDDGHIAHHKGDVTIDQFKTREYSRFVPLTIGGKDMMIAFSETDRFHYASTNLAWSIAIAGFLLSGALSTILYTLGSTVRRARALAQSMTKDLKRLALVAENTNNLVIITDKDRRFEWVNKGFTRLTGYTIDEVRGKSPGKLLQTEQTDKAVVQTVREALDAGRGCRVELLNKSKTGQEYVLDMEIQPLHDEEGQVAGFIAVETDVTEKVTARNRLESIFRAMAEGLLVQSIDGSIIECNPEAERILGLPREQILGPITEKNKWRCVKETGEDWPVTDHPIFVTLSTGRPVRNTVMGIYLGDGDLHWISLNTQAILGPDGQVLSAISTFADISERINARNELDLKERTLRTMFNKSRQLAGTLSPQGVLLDVNKTALDFIGLTEKDKDQVVGKYFWETPWWTADPEQCAWIKAAIEDAAKGQTVRRQTAHRDPKGRIHYVDFSMTPILDKDGRVMMLIPEGWEVTESIEAADALRQARDAADQATRSKSEFLANMSHEIRTPMTAILGYTDLLADEWDHGMTQRQRLEYISTIKRNGEHLLSIINDILDLSKIETGKMTVESIETNPDQLVFDVVSLMSVKAKAKGISLSSQYDTAIPQTIKSDPLRLRQILVNLVGNAIKFTEVGSVTIRVNLEKNGPEGPRLNFEIHDTGIGLTRPQMDKLFGAFEQADATTTRKFGGTGLGLRISKRLAEILGGDITVTSQPGKGSVFTLRISTGPLDNVAIVMPTSKPQVVRETGQNAHPVRLDGNILQGLKVLMVEDGPDNQRLIAYHLRKAGAIVSTADNGEMAVKALTIDKSVDGPIDPNAAGYDLLLMDMQMPVMDGYTATRLLRNKGCTLPIIALTAHAMAGDAERCLDAGCDDYTAKPIDRDKLIGICAAWINKDRSFISADLAKSAAPVHIDPKSTPPTAPAGTPAPARPTNPSGLGQPGQSALPTEKLRSTFHEDKSMAGLIAEFAEKLPQRAEQMQTLLQSNAMDDLTRLAHQMAGAAGSYGYPTITQAARVVEKKAQERPADLPALMQACNHVRQLCLMAAAGLK